MLRPPVSSRSSAANAHRTLRRFAPRLLALVLALIIPGIRPLADPSSDSPGSDGAVVRVATLDPTELDRLRAVVDFWGIDRTAGEAVVWATAEERAHLAALGFDLRIDDGATERYHTIARAGAERGATGEPTPEGTGIPGFPCYRTVPETYADLAQLAVDHPQLASWIDIGDSWEKINGPGTGFDVHALVLTNTAIGGPKPPLVIIAAMHAREYTTAELASRFDVLSRGVIVASGMRGDVEPDNLLAFYRQALRSNGKQGRHGS